MATKKESTALYARFKRANSLFELLGVHRASTTEEIGLARKALARVAHPDRMNGDGGIMSAINAAHGTLTDKPKRMRYLAELASGRVTCSACNGDGYTSVQKGFAVRIKTACAQCGGCGLTFKEKK